MIMRWEEQSREAFAERLGTGAGVWPLSLRECDDLQLPLGTDSIRTHVAAKGRCTNGWAGLVAVGGPTVMRH